MSNAPNILIFDYGMGNIFSITRALEHLGAKVEVTSEPSRIAETEFLLLPGVGAFGKAMGNLSNMGAIEPLKTYLGSQKKFLGICLGFQLLFEKSSEFGDCDGLSVLKGEIKKFETEFLEKKIKVPHIGWEHVIPKMREGIVSSIEQNKNCFYFVHSYYAQPQNKQIISSTSKYEGFEYCSSIETDNILACQFHPEKSGDVGLKLLKEWINK